CIENEILMFFRTNNKNLKNVSLNESIGFDKEGNEITILDVLKAPKPDFLEELDKKENIQLLIQYLNILTPREKEIIIRRYGLYQTDSQTQKMIAKELKISRSYVSRIEKRALTKILREFLKTKKQKEKL
ncbi:MAG: sigma-70 family RNA polymerase sigma factor, partial [Bacilli bacterium]|nr:sigma-70 family RNA polymerase sigma factor [Bacilli bacterium]